MLGTRRTTLASPRLVYQKKKLFKKRIVWSGLVVGAFIVTLVLMSRISSLQIRNIQVVGNEAIAADAIKAKADETLNQYYLWLFPKRNVLFYPDNVIASSVSSNWSRIDEVTVNANSLSSLTITVKEKTAKYVWCGFERKDFLEDTSTTCYLLDDSGKIFDTTGQISGGMYLKMFGLIDTADVVGKTYMDNTEREKILSLVDLLEDQSLHVVRLYVRDNSFGLSQKNFEYELMLGNGIRLILNSATDPEKAILALKTLAGKNSLLGADYIDFRFENKVYYKSR